jgi:uncharacterized protein
MRRLALILILLAGPAVADPALVAAARGQVGVTITYDPAYVALPYPMGDLDRTRGVCTDVVIRALRDAHGIDLQRAVHRDMARAFAAYPRTWGLTRTDRNIDHRRVGNLATLLSRVGAEVETGTRPEDFQPGDIVTQVLPGNLPHIALVSDRRSADGLRPLVLHNIGRGAAEEDTLFGYQITGQFRLEAASIAALRALDAP